MNTINEIQLIYSNEIDSTVKISNSQTAYNLLLDNWNVNTIQLQEEFKALFLNRANNVLGIYHMSKGGVAGTVVDMKLLLTAALKSNASSIIVAHNHPSGNIQYSSQDKILTKKIKKAAEYLDLQLIDHIIITKSGYYSFSDEGDL
ncbi:JAB domain-containing protein [Ulvibacter litoralis]|uniref:DNA repair protein radc n=1 Tax=Ulvibacter litoralis TaxID=227084 RepID=A0A1G7CNU8_9FLAO|nr:JAB domain-containing protein [Ulvibacter litoralis]GHC46697.1 DNA repair protein [Ulvibacter litoralis]SDE41012.1 DNA repair protein radc [Ulvibacter litoralis]